MFVVDVPRSAVVANIPAYAFEVQLSADGMTMAFSNRDWSSLNVASLPGGAIRYSFPYNTGIGDPPNPPSLQTFAMSSDANVLGVVLAWISPETSALDTFETDITDLSGATKLLTTPPGPFVQFPHLSPSGRYWAMLEESLQSTDLYAGAALIKSVKGFPLGWTDDDHVVVLVDNQPRDASCALGSVLYDNQGNTLATGVMPCGIVRMDPIGPTTFFAPADARIYDATSGAVLSDTGLPAGSAVAGSYILSVVDRALVATRY
jgi:hypothetical protein